MKLSETWFMEGHIDFELQKYRLLAYLQEVNKYFNETKLYPQLSDVIFHYNNLVAFRNNKKLLEGQFPQQLNALDVHRLELIYEKMLADDELMQELENITQYGIDKMKGIIDDGTGIYEFVEKQLTFEPVGIMPLYKNEGYLLLRYGNETEIRAYAYTITLFEHKDARYKGIKLNYVDSYTKKLTNTYEQIKLEIIRQIRSLPNPAVYSITSPMAVPFAETLLPIAKRMLVRHISQAA